MQNGSGNPGSPEQNSTDIESSSKVHEDKKQRRAQQSRHASREYRKRKKRSQEDMEKQLNVLIEENSELKSKLHQQIASQHLQQFQQQQQQQRDALPCLNLQDEWKKDVASLQELLRNKAQEAINEEAVSRVLNSLQDKGKHLLAVAKLRDLASLDWTIFANHALFGVDSEANNGLAANDIAVDIADKNSIGFWLTLAHDVGIPTVKQDELAVEIYALRKALFQLKTEHQRLITSLIALLRTGATNVEQEWRVDVGHIVAVTTKMAELQRTHESYWNCWEKSVGRLLSLLTPIQRAQLLIRKQALLDNAAVLNSIWLNLHKLPVAAGNQPNSWHPLLFPPLPLPIQLQHFI